MIYKILIITAILSILTSCNNRYSNVEIGSDDVNAYVETFTILDANFKEFSNCLNNSDNVDTTTIDDFDEISDIINYHGFNDVNYFFYVHKKLKPIIEIIKHHPEIERFPGISIADLSFLDESEKQYSEFLKSDSVSANDKEFYRAQMAQIETTKVDLYDKQQKNKAWIAFIRKEVGSPTNVKLTDKDIMQLTILERELSKL